MTVIEMLVAIAIFVIGIEGFTLLFVRGWRANSYTFEMGQASFAVSQGVQEITKNLRKARQGDDGDYPLESVADNDLVFYANYDGDDATERLHIYKSADKIMLGITNPSAGMPKTYPAGDQETKTVAERIVNDAGTPIFSYYNKDYPADTISNPLTAPVVSEVKLVKIYLQINIDPNHAPDNIEQQTFVEIRNLNDYDRIQ